MQNTIIIYDMKLSIFYTKIEVLKVNLHPTAIKIFKQIHIYIYIHNGQKFLLWKSLINKFRDTFEIHILVSTKISI